MIHTVKGFSIVNKAKVDVFLEFPCFLYNPMNVVNLISGSSAFSKPSLYIWKFSIQVLLKPSLKDFEHVQDPQKYTSVFPDSSIAPDRAGSGGWGAHGPIPAPGEWTWRGE